jgi:hypothetical protein
MKTATLRRVGPGNIAARWLGLLAMAAFLLGAASLRAQSSKTQTTVTTLGGGPQSYNPGSNFGSSNSVYGTLDSQFHTPSGLAFDSFQNFLYVADRDNNAIRLIDLSDPANPSETYTFAPYPPYVPTNLISQPVGVAVDALGDVFVLNRGKGANGTVVEFDYFGDLLATNMTRLTNASAIALDTAGDIYVTASNTVFKITPAGVSNVVVTITNAGTLLQGIVVKRSGTSAGWLAVCDSGRNGIYLINPTNGAVTTNAGFNGVGDGTGNRNQGVSNPSAKFFQPSGLAEAGDGSLIVADFGNDRVKVVTASGITTNLYGVSSNYWWTGKTPTGGTAIPGWSDGAVWEPDGGTGNVQARMPFGVTIGPDGTVYTSEDYYHIIRKVAGPNIQLPPPWPPPPPQGPAATAGYGQVYLTWMASSGATNYNVKRSPSSGGETTVASTTGTSYTDTNLLDGTINYYVVSALNTGGEGQNSAEASATPLFSPTPINLTVTATNYGLVSLAWSMSAGATSYNVKRSPSHGGPYATIGSAASTSYNDTSVANGTTYYYVVSAVNAGGENPVNSAEVSATPPLPPVPDPQIGYVDFPATSTPIQYTSVFHPVSSYQFYNDATIVIKGTPGSGTYYTYNGTTPTTNSASVLSDYQDGIPSLAGLSPYIVPQIAPDFTIEAIGTETNRPNSAVVQATFEFITGNPTIIGNNAAQFAISDITANSHLYYTIDGSTPSATNGVDLGSVPTPTNYWTVGFSIVTNTLFQVVAIRPNYQSSAVVNTTFSVSNYLANIISFGFGGAQEASSDFVASPGQIFYAPVTLSPLSGATMYSLQFNLTATNAGPNPGPTIASGAFEFKSMLLNLIKGVYYPIPPYMFVGSGTNPPPPSVPSPIMWDGNWFQNLVFTNGSKNLLGVGWMEEILSTNLYDTTTQDLIKYSAALNDVFDQSAGKVILGGFAFQVPGAATNGQSYQIQIGRASATSDGIGAPGSSVLIASPTNGVNVNGYAVSALENVTVGQRKYIAGSVYPFRWFNAGDFGSTNIVNADVEQVFGFAVYGGGGGFPSDSDLFDAMDSCGNIGVLDGNAADANFGYYTNAGAYTGSYSIDDLFNGNDTTINQVAFGDGVLDVCDVYVTFRRSLDPSLTWYRRFWNNGQRVADTGAPNVAAKAAKTGTAPTKAVTSATVPPQVNFSAGDIQGSAGQVVQIPINATVFGGYPLRVLMLNLTVEPLDGSPVLTTPVQFTQAAPLGAPYITESKGAGNYAAVWLNSTNAGVTGAVTLGTLTVTIPANATGLSAYAVHFDHASASPNGVASFPKQTLTGLITLSSRSISSYNDGIPDAWRLRWFGTIYNQLSVSNACPSGDGINNWMKYVAGVDPNTPNDFPSLNSTTTPAPGANMGIYWPTVSGKQYAILSSASLFPGNWTTNTIVTGTGANMEFDDNPSGAAKFYRVLILP